VHRGNRGFLKNKLENYFEGIVYYFFCDKGPEYKAIRISFNECFSLYLFNLRYEKHIITHYYRSMLVRLKFEVHTIARIFLLWLGIFYPLLGFIFYYQLENDEYSFFNFFHTEKKMRKNAQDLIELLKKEYHLDK
jgi:hypothetical protein